MIHELPLERRTLHGHFSRDLPPVVTIDSGDTVAFSCLDSAWHITPAEKFEPRDEELDAGHALVGPIELRGARRAVRRNARRRLADAAERQARDERRREPPPPVDARR